MEAEEGTKVLFALRPQGAGFVDMQQMQSKERNSVLSKMDVPA
jgi:hypothetical protein